MLGILPSGPNCFVFVGERPSTVVSSDPEPACQPHAQLRAGSVSPMHGLMVALAITVQRSLQHETKLGEKYSPGETKGQEGEVDCVTHR